MAEQRDVKTYRELYDGIAQLLFASDQRRFWKIWREYQTNQQPTKKPRTGQHESISRAAALLKRQE